MTDKNTSRGYEELRELAESIAYNTRLSEESISRMYGISKKELLGNMMQQMQETLGRI